MDGIVLVHGGMHGSWGWDPLLPHLELPAVAVDLPGRGRRPADLASVTIDDCVAAVLADADDAGFGRFCLVGHSMGGITISTVASRHPERVGRLVYVGALVPAVGQCAGDLMGTGPLEAMPVLAEETAKALFGNDLTDEQWDEHYAGLVPDAPGIYNARVDRHPTGVPITYVSMTQDQPVPPALVEQMLPNLGDDVDLRTIDAGHTVMVSEPAALAAIVNEVARR